MALQATGVGRFKGAELALEGLVVPVVSLHMSVQAAVTQEEKRKKYVKNKYFKQADI